MVMRHAVTAEYLAKFPKLACVVRMGAGYDKINGHDVPARTSFKTESRLAEVWRDLQVVGQGATLAPEWYPIGGRAFLGLGPGPRLR